MHPEKNLAAVESEFILRRFREKSFAKGANREQILTCGDMGLELNEFTGIALSAMQGISSELGF